PNTAYTTMQIGAFESSINASTQSPTGPEFSTTTAASPPTITSFQVYRTSIQIVMGLNGNLTGTPLMISTGTGGHYAVTNSSVGVYDSATTTLTIVGLTTATVYSFQAGARDSTSGAATQTTIVTLTTSTLAAPPTITSFQIFTTSIQIVMGLNSNPTGTPLMISTGTGNHYEVTNSSVGIYDGATTALTIIGLTSGTVYSFQAGVRDGSSGAATQTTVVTLTTSTLAAPPIVTGFQVFATSISVTINPNGNSNGAGISISTNGFAANTSSVGIVAGNPTTLAITGLTVDTTYNLDVGAFDTTGGASTQSASGNEISTRTRTMPPTITSFQVYRTSIQIVMGLNGNPPGIPLVISTGAGGHFTVTNSSIGIYDTVATTLTIVGLTTATVYSFQAGTRGSASGADTQTTIVTASTATSATIPLMTGFQVFATSITVFVDPSGNPNGTGLSISSSNFAANTSSVGVVSGNPTRLTMTNLEANTLYMLQVGAFDPGANASTQSADGIEISTTTDVNAPAIISFQIFTTSISVALGLNGNATGTPVMISTGAGSYFDVSNSSIGIMGPSTTTLVISNLSTATVYGFQAGARRADNNPTSTRPVSITESTSTLAAAPLVSSFQVFATSVVVNINPNTNPAGTKISISSNSFGVASSTVGVVSGAGQLTTMTISGLIPNTAYDLNVGAFDSTGGASTQSAAGNEISTTTLVAPPTITSFRIFATSISVTVGANGNPSGNALMISTGTGGFYDVANSSKGIIAGANTTFVISNLSSATAYSFQAGVRASAGTSTETTIITASTSTLAAVPILGSWDQGTNAGETNFLVVFSTSGITNGTRVVVSTGTNGHFDVAYSSAGILSLADAVEGFFTLIIPGLTPNTTYGFQAGARDNTVNAVTQSVTIITSTRTLASSPGPIGFRIFTTSISVTLGANGNPVGTALMVSTGNASTFDVANSSKGIVAGANTILVISNLSTATLYDFWAGAVESGVSASTNINIVALGTSTLAALPTITSYQAFQSSISVTLGANGNPVGTVIVISTGTGRHFDVANSSIGIIAGAETTLFITGLTGSTAYGVQAGARDGTDGASTQAVTVVASTTTTGSGVTITSFQVFTTSISVTMGANGNPNGDALMISTGTGGFYDVANSSKGIIAGANTTLVISNLSTSTVYSFQAGVRAAAGTSTQNATITSSTSTLAVSPTVSSFQVFATSVVVNIHPNSNPAGTGLSVSTNAFGIASSTVGVVSGAGQLTTMTITGLNPNTAYDLNVGAFDGTGSASTQSASGNEISTRTRATAPTITSFQIYTTSISVTLGANNNPAGTTLTLSTGTGGHYAVSNSSKGIVSGSNTTLAITGLTANTVYGFMAGANDSSSSASTQTTVVTSSTRTLSANPTVT
ncbi:MAG: hypothetical protein HYY63_02345, partial [Elusimicrobia bacterium]|nr:hypothetical protein [Elusimicrobiota bacterium]